MRWLDCAVFVRFLCVAAVSLMLALSAFSQLDPQSGSWPVSKVPGAVPKVGDSIAPRHDSTVCLINSAQLDPCYVAVDNGIDYQVAYRKIEGFRITDVRTNDPRFVSPEGLKVGDVITISKQDDLILAPYFAVYAEQGKVWVPIISEYPDRIIVANADGRDTEVPFAEFHLEGKAVHVRIRGFVQRSGVDWHAR